MSKQVGDFVKQPNCIGCSDESVTIIRKCNVTLLALLLQRTFVCSMFSIRWVFRSVLSVALIHLSHCGELWFTLVQSVVWTLQMEKEVNIHE